jgi:hypothetical protein
MTPNQSHGHVTPNADGSRARCGGPTICKVCMAELAQLQAKSAPAESVSREVEIPDIAATFDGLYLVPIKPLNRGDHLMTVAQHNRIVAALTPPSPDAELVELLRECRGIVAKEVERWNKVAAFLLEDGSVKSGLLARIDAKLASLK